VCTLVYLCLADTHTLFLGFGSSHEKHLDLSHALSLFPVSPFFLDLLKGGNGRHLAMARQRRVIGGCNAKTTHEPD